MHDKNKACMEMVKAMRVSVSVSSAVLQL